MIISSLSLQSYLAPFFYIFFVKPMCWLMIVLVLLVCTHWSFAFPLFVLINRLNKDRLSVSLKKIWSIIIEHLWNLYTQIRASIWFTKNYNWQCTDIILNFTTFATNHEIVSQKTSVYIRLQIVFYCHFSGVGFSLVQQGSKILLKIKKKRDKNIQKLYIWELKFWLSVAFGGASCSLFKL